MEVTAYCPASGGNGGRTSLGKPAQRGVIAVDPHAIPLGTLLYVPGYGMGAPPILAGTCAETIVSISACPAVTKRNAGAGETCACRYSGSREGGLPVSCLKNFEL